MRLCGQGECQEGHRWRYQVSCGRGIGRLGNGCSGKGTKGVHCTDCKSHHHLSHGVRRMIGFVTDRIDDADIELHDGFCRCTKGMDGGLEAILGVSRWE